MFVLADGQPGLVHPAGRNFRRAVETAGADIVKAGQTFYDVGTVSSFTGFQNMLDFAAKVGANGIAIFTHGDEDNLYIGDGVPDGMNTIDMKNANRLVNPSGSRLTSIFIYGCNAGSTDNGIAARLAKQLNVYVHAATGGNDFL